VQRDEVAEPLKPDYNVAPTKPVYTVIDRAERPVDGESAAEATAGSGDADGATVARELRIMRWGLVPFWAKDVKVGSRMINARAETVAEKPAFRRAFAKRRCLIPADGYYEWQKIPGASKQPMYISRADGRSLSFAGLYELWRDPAVPPDDQDSWLWTTTIITTSAPDELGMIHDRMPMIIDAGSWADWLDPANNDIADLKGLLTPAMVGDLTTWPVSTAVNSVRNNGPELIERVSVRPADALAAGVPRAGKPAAGAQAARDFGGDSTGALF